MRMPTGAARLLAGAVAVLPASSVLAACGAGATRVSASSHGSQLQVVAAENFWGSLATQLAGGRASVQSIIADPATDPHSYEPKAGDARTLATARLVIVNGAGYDPWAPKLLAANPVSGRTVLTVGDRLGLKEGDNPHRWYDPASVETVANTITADLTRLDPNDAGYFSQQRARFETQALAEYHRLISTIKARYAGVPVGASESIFALLSPSLGLDLITPPSFMKSIGEGTEVTAQDTATTQRQLATGQARVWIYNSQNATPGIQRLNAIARRRGIPIATITETLSPPTATFEAWQSAQLRGIEHALHQATSR
jgi:zinc/manganese transport system substrate-binding protein